MAEQEAEKMEEKMEQPQAEPVAAAEEPAGEVVAERAPSAAPEVVAAPEASSPETPVSETTVAPAQPAAVESAPEAPVSAEEGATPEQAKGSTEAESSAVAEEPQAEPVAAAEEQHTEAPVESAPPAASEVAAVPEEPTGSAPAESESLFNAEEPESWEHFVSTLEMKELATGSPAIAAEKPSGEAAVEAEAAAAPTPTVTPAEFAALKAERDQLLDRVARLQAEFENARKRTERERQEFRDYAIGSVVEHFLPVVDDFELALKAGGTEEQLRSGVELIIKKMEGVLSQLQVHAIPSLGAEFDPRHHEALGTEQRDDLPDQQVAKEIRRGYRLRERLLRPALVLVASNPKQTSE